MLPSAEANLQPELRWLRREGRPRIGCLLRGKRQARQGDLQQAKLPLAQVMAAAPAVEPIRRRFDDVRGPPANPLGG
jgi:hypothetical protein